jgi:hypothetical protein
MKGAFMDFMEKTRIQMEHWARHTEDHLQEYEEFANALDTAGKSKTALHIREMAALIGQGNRCLLKAVQTLEQG